MTPATYYKKNKAIAEEALKQVQSKLNTNTTLRLVTFLATLGGLFGLAQINLTIAIAVSIASFFCFISLVRYHVKLQRKKQYLTSWLGILNKELEAVNHIFSSFREGEEYVNHQHRYSHDLDLFGKGSLFQMLNRTVTQSGEDVLAEHISTELTNIAEIQKLQEGVSELAERSDLLVHFRTTGSISDVVKEDKKEIDKWRKEASYISGKKWVNGIRFVLPAITLSSLLFVIFTGMGATILTTLFVLNLIVTGKFFKSTNKEHNKLSKFISVFSKYKDLLAIFEEQEFKSPILKELKDNIAKEEQSASKALLSLTKAVGALDNRLNVVASIFLQGLLLYDFHCLVKIEKWRKAHQHKLPEWLENIARFDAYTSMATFAFNNSDFIYPSMSKDLVLEAEALGHPFIPGSVRVPNDFSINSKGDFVIVTGANMAGKSTFLRTVGVNMVLAMAGLPVCAKSFVFTPRKIYSSMRTSDSLNENESYFYAELKRMKNLIDLLEEGEDLFIILDEILKGTNSVDKQKGSQLALEKIIGLKGSGIIATHDLALTEMVDSYPKIISNQCFEIEIDNAKIEFDYKLYKGVTQNMNAMLLMEQMGIISAQ